MPVSNDSSNKDITNYSNTSQTVQQQQSQTFHSSLSNSVFGREISQNPQTSMTSRLRGFFSRASSGSRSPEEARTSQSSHKTSSLLSTTTKWQKFTSLFKRKTSRTSTSESEAAQDQENKFISSFDQQIISKNIDTKTISAPKVSPSNDPEAESIRKNIGLINRGDAAGVYLLYKTAGGKLALDDAARKGYYDESTKFFNDFSSIEPKIELALNSKDDDKELYNQIKSDYMKIIDAHITANSVNVGGPLIAEFNNLADKIKDKDVTKEDIIDMRGFLKQVEIQSDVMVCDVFKKSQDFKNLQKDYAKES